jgi:predicted nucleic acid-binding protein
MGQTSDVVVDTSVILKWFHAENESEVAESRAVFEAHRLSLLTAFTLDLAVYELGNILVRKKGWPASRTSDQLDDLLLLCGPTLVPAPAWRHDAADLASAYALSFYDASFAAAARALRVPLLSTDQKLIAAQLAQSPSSFVEEHGAHIRKTP